MHVQQLRVSYKFKLNISDLLESVHRQATLLEQFSKKTNTSVYKKINNASHMNENFTKAERAALFLKSKANF